jgi:hypothetical protein
MLESRMMQSSCSATKASAGFNRLLVECIARKARIDLANVDLAKIIGLVGDTSAQAAAIS